jgi:hypothetical protein
MNNLTFKKTIKMKKIFTYLMATIALILVSFGAMAQGGLTPLVESTHEYNVTAESSGNTLAWSVLEGAAGTEYTINSATSTETVNITWNIAGTYTLQFSEENGNTCVTLKQATVVVSANTFDVNITNPTEICNAKDGTINPTGDATTSITFTVDMTTAYASWSPNWEITFTLTPAGSATIANISSSVGTPSENTGVYTITGVSSTSGDGTVDITMDVTGDAFTLQTVALAITSAKELDYDTPDVDSDDWLATQTINALPSTSEITTD